MTHGRVLHAGQIILDMVLDVPAVPEVGGDMYARSFELVAGGGFNVMAAAARDGAEVLYLGGHGAGPFGDIARDALRREAIDALAPVDARQDTGFCVALIDDDAERTFVSTKGAEFTSSLEVFAAADPQEGDVIYVSGYSLLPSEHRDVLLAWLPRIPAECVVVFDPGPLLAELEEEALDAVSARIDVWSLNEREAQILAKRFDFDVSNLETAPTREQIVRDLAAWTGGAVVLRCGADGAVVADGSHTVAIRAPAVDAVDTNGAGDAHCGVLCSQLASGAPLIDAAKRATHAAAIAVTRHGPATSPTAEEINAAMRGLGFGSHQ